VPRSEPRTLLPLSVAEILTNQLLTHWALSSLSISGPENKPLDRRLAHGATLNSDGFHSVLAV